MPSRAEQIANLRREIAALDKPPADSPANPPTEGSKAEVPIDDHAPTFDDLRSAVRAARVELQHANSDMAAAHATLNAAIQRSETADDQYKAAVEALVEAA